MDRLTRRSLLAALALAGCDDPRVAPPGAGRDAGRADARPGERCEPLTISPPGMRVATGSVTFFRVTGGSGTGVLFHAAEGAALGGAAVSLAGGITAGPMAARFTVIADDATCGLVARAEVEVVGPFQVTPARATVPPGATVRFAVTGSLDTPRWTRVGSERPAVGTFDPAATTFTAGSATGTSAWIVTDPASGRELPVSVEVATGATLRARVAMVMVPAGGRVRLDWLGGSSALDATIDPATTGAALTRDDGATWFDAARARPGAVAVRVTDRATGARAEVRVIVGEELPSTPAVRGEVTASGSLAWGDFNGDHRPDLAIGHPTMHSGAPYAGRVAVHLSPPSGPLPDVATVNLDGRRAQDFYGASLRALDVTGDGFDDLLVGSPERDLHRANVGTVEVWAGAPDGLSAAPLQTLVGAVDNERFGASFLVDELTGDGLPDLVVVAPGARGPALAPGPCAPIGRVFVHAGTRIIGRPFEATPSQTLELIVPDPDGCHDAEVASVSDRPALFDVDGDGARDLVLGVPAMVATDRAGFQGRVIAYHHAGRAGFERRPARVLALDDVADAASFGAGVDVVPAGASSALLVRAPQYHRDPATGALGPEPRGAVFAFAPGSFGAGGTADAPQHLTTAIARARFVGGPYDGAGASAAVGDVDGDGATDYLLGGFVAGLPVPGRVWLFDAPSLARSLRDGVALAPVTTLRGASTESLGSALAVDASAAGPARAVAVGAALRSTAVGYLTGGVDALAPASPAPLDARWGARRAIALPQRAGGDTFGASVAVGALRPGGGGDVFVGAPLAHLRVGETVRARAGTVGLFPSDGAAREACAGEREFALVGTSVAALDFNGDGRLDLAVGDPTAPAGGWDVVRRGLVATPPDARCFLRTSAGAVQDAPVLQRGIVRVFTQQTDGRLVERFHVYGREPDAERGLRGAIGQTVANALDVNHDGLQDLVVTHAGTYRGAGAEVILGRADDPAGRIQVVCGDPAEAPWWPARADGAGHPNALGLGDLDGDGCAETAAGVAGNVRVGAVVRFGFGPRCARGHDAPFDLALVVDGRRFDNNRLGDLPSRDDDDLDRTVLTLLGSAIGAPGDVTGDGVPDLLLRDHSWALGDGSDPAVEVISGAWVAGLCPDHRCPQGRTGPLWADGDYRRAALQDVAAPHRVVIRSPLDSDPGFGVALAGADLDGDGLHEVIVGAPESSLGGPRAGAVLAWRGGALGGEPWMIAVGDVRAATRFGQSLDATSATAGAWLVVGAPHADRHGPATGAAFRWRVTR